MNIVHQLAVVLGPGQNQQWTIWGFPLNWFVKWDVNPARHPNFLFPGFRSVELDIERTIEKAISPDFWKEYRFVIRRKDSLPFPIIAHVYFGYEEFPIEWTFPGSTP